MIALPAVTRMGRVLLPAAAERSDCEIIFDPERSAERVTADNVRWKDRLRKGLRVPRAMQET